MTKNQEKKQIKNSTAITVGICIIGVTLLIVAAVIFYPSVRARAVLKDMLSLLSEDNIKSATVYDPDAGKDLFHAGGVEHIATDEELKTLFELMQKTADRATYVSDDTKEILFDYDYRIRFRLADGESVSFFFSDGNFYVTKDGTRYFFAARDEAAYRDIMALASSLIKSESP